jgi:hypothetical protein
MLAADNFVEQREAHLHRFAHRAARKSGQARSDLSRNMKPDGIVSEKVIS